MAGGVTAEAAVTVTVAEHGVGSYVVAATLVHIDAAGGNLTWRAKLKPHADYGGNVTIEAACKSGCTNTTSATVTNATYGDGKQHIFFAPMWDTVYGVDIGPFLNRCAS